LCGGRSVERAAVICITVMTGITFDLIW